MNLKHSLQFVAIVSVFLFFFVPFSWAGKREDAIIKYYKEVHAKIVQAWVVPRGNFGEGRELESKILFFINERGKLASHEWKEKTGYDALDVSCLQAIQNASPFSLPPSEAWLNVFQRGILVICRPTGIRLGSTGSSLCQQAEQKINEGYIDVTLLERRRETYFSELVSLIRKKYWFSSLAQQRIVESTWGGYKTLDASVGVELAISGEVTNVELLCPSSSSVFNAELLRILKKMKKFPSVQAHLAKEPNGTLKMILGFSLYIKGS